jgi:hypothetical protein
MVPPMSMEELLSFHRAACRHVVGDSTLPVPTDLIGHFRAFHDARFERAFANKVMFLRDGTARFRWPYILLFALLTVPPTRFVSSAYDRRRARRTLAEVLQGRLMTVRHLMSEAAATQTQRCIGP